MARPIVPARRPLLTPRRTRSVTRGLLLAVVLSLPAIAASPPGARGANGMVSSPEKLATDVGVQVLLSGGNAIDAAVAVSFALSVTYPQAGALGAGGFLL